MKRSNLYYYIYMYSIHTVHWNLKKNISILLKFCNHYMCEYGAVVEYRSRDLRVGGSNPLCSTFYDRKLRKSLNLPGYVHSFSRSQKLLLKVHTDSSRTFYSYWVEKALLFSNWSSYSRQIPSPYDSNFRRFSLNSGGGGGGIEEHGRSTCERA